MDAPTKRDRGIPDGQPNGWDARDSTLWGQIQALPSYGIIAGGDTMISRKQVIDLLSQAAEKRFNLEWSLKLRGGSR